MVDNKENYKFDLRVKGLICEIEISNIISNINTGKRPEITVLLNHH